MGGDQAITDYVADPDRASARCTRAGAAVDATLVDGRVEKSTMPTEFDNFTPQAMLYYLGPDSRLITELYLLQAAMARAGFYGLRTEWWHSRAGDWTKYPPVPEVNFSRKRSRLDAYDCLHPRDLQQPEYLHVLINPLPVYGLAIALFGLVAAMYLGTRGGQIAASFLFSSCAASAWPVAHYGEAAEDRVQAMADETDEAWLKAHAHRADELIYVFYALAVFAVAPFSRRRNGRRPRRALPSRL